MNNNTLRRITRPIAPGPTQADGLRGVINQGFYFHGQWKDTLRLSHLSFYSGVYSVVPSLTVGVPVDMTPQMVHGGFLGGWQVPSTPGSAPANLVDGRFYSRDGSLSTSYVGIKIVTGSWGFDHSGAAGFGAIGVSTDPNDQFAFSYPLSYVIAPNVSYFFSFFQSAYGFQVVSFFGADTEGGPLNINPDPNLTPIDFLNGPFVFPGSPTWWATLYHIPNAWGAGPPIPLKGAIGVEYLVFD